MPSIDIVKLDDNEGATYDQNLKLLFAGTHPASLLVVLN